MPTTIAKAATARAANRETPVVSTQEGYRNRLSGVKIGPGLEKYLMKRIVTTVVIAGLALGTAVLGQRAGTDVTFDHVVGAWSTTTEGGRTVLTHDGKTKPPLFPIAIAKQIPDVRAGRIRAEFKLIAGPTDQSAGIVFGLGEDGRYYFGRYNTKDGNVAIWMFEKDTRTVLSHGEVHKQLPLNEWHDISVTIEGRVVTVSAAKDTLRASHTLPSPVRGRIGFWTKPDAVTAFRGLSVESI